MANRMLPLSLSSHSCCISVAPFNCPKQYNGVFVSRVTAVAAAAWSKSDFLASPQGTTTVWKQGGLGKGLELKKGMKDGRRGRSVRVAVIRDSSGGSERTYVMVKPDGVQRGLVGEIISRFERKGFVLKGLKLWQAPEELAQNHYFELKEKPFYPKLVKYIISGPVVCMAWEGPGVVASARKLIGVTNPLQAEPGTIRGDFGIEVGRNVVHGSDSPENGEREIALWFKDSELVEWEQSITPWLRE
ncbi:hypothetical protein CY35_01G064100 [Sphagnum magellanicum]|nr:hypothetical protein CY35_01G064100 [Sphagnum magellanicum]